MTTRYEEAAALVAKSDELMRRTPPDTEELHELANAHIAIGNLDPALDVRLGVLFRRLVALGQRFLVSFDIDEGFGLLLHARFDRADLNAPLALLTILEHHLDRRLFPGGGLLDANLTGDDADARWLILARLLRRDIEDRPEHGDLGAPLSR